jgi:hypothetical protein
MMVDPPFEMQDDWKTKVGSRYAAGEKGILLYVLAVCADSKLPHELPDWAKQALTDAWDRYSDGTLESWDEIFGKPFLGKRRGSSDRAVAARQLKVWTEVRRRVYQGQSLGDDLFEAVGRDLGIGGKSTVNRIYYEVEQLNRAFKAKLPKFPP